MPQVDTHVHVVSGDRAKYPLNTPNHPGVGEPWHFKLSVTTEQLLQSMAGAGVDAAVLVQGFTPYGYDNSYVIDSVRQHPKQFTGVGVENDLDQEAPRRLRVLVEQHGIRGLRIIARERREPMDDPRAVGLWRGAADLRIPVCVQMTASQIPQFRRMLERFPTVAVALDHMARPDVRGGPPYRAAQPLFDLAHYPNVYLKWTTTNLDAVVEASGVPQDLLWALADRFGAHRLMWGSNYSATFDRPYAVLAEAGRQAVGRLSPEEQRWALGETALRLWPELLP